MTDSNDIEIAFINRRDADMALTIEPWGAEFSIPPGERRGPSPGELELHVEGTRLVVWAWQGSRVTVWHGDGQVF
jgi:hypothetical protein